MSEREGGGEASGEWMIRWTLLVPAILADEGRGRGGAIEVWNGIRRLVL